MTITLPPPIQQFFASTNRGDTAGFLATFTPDASLTDWGRHFHGHDGIAAWNETDNIGVQSHLEATEVKQDGHRYVVTVQVAGKGFNGTGRMTFELKNDLILRLVID